MLSVKHYIDRNRLTMEAFGKSLGVTRATVCRLIAGDRHPSLHLLRKIHEVTGIPYKKLINECT